MDKEQRAEELIDEIESVMEREDFEYREEYSGRGMFGDVSAVALVTPASPNSDVGEDLQDLGLCVDNMGLNYVYYTKWSL